MPEGHVLHYLARDLNAAFAGKPVQVSSPQGVFAAGARALDGRRFSRAEAWGKHLFLLFGATPDGSTDGTASAGQPPARIVHIHLGLIGKLGLQPHTESLLPGKVRLQLSDGHTLAHLHGPQWCRLITDAEMDHAIARLGADPLRPEDPFNQEKLNTVKTKVLRSRRSLASQLMDQKLFAGVGNIYRAEVLFRLGLNPDTTGKGLASETFDLMWQDLVELMQRGVAAGRIDTVHPEHTPEAMGRSPRKDDHGGEVYVYRRAGQPCHVCATQISARVMEGRNLFWCPGCQA